jgi:hypothetical protein
MRIPAFLSRFRPSKASVEPVLRTDDPGMPIPLDACVYPHCRGDCKPQPQHPLAPEREPPALDWASWSFMQRETFRRGWSFARYAVKSPSSEMACVFGIVRGPWGICKMDFFICGPRTFDTLHTITHLPFWHGLRPVHRSGIGRDRLRHRNSPR